MLDEFYNGKLAVYVNKTNAQDISLAKKILAPFFEELNLPAIFGPTAEDYVAALDSGPYHFINGNCADGADIRYCKSYGMKIISIYEFAEQIEQETEIEETEFMSLLGV